MVLENPVAADLEIDIEVAREVVPEVAGDGAEGREFVVDLGGGVLEGTGVGVPGGLAGHVF